MSGRKRNGTDYQRRYICRGQDKHFFRMYESLLHSPSFRKLTPIAKLLYIEMGLSSNGKIEFTFPYSAYSKHFSKDGFLKAKRQLIEGGFITEVSYRTTANRYSLSDGWQGHFDGTQNRKD